MMTVKEPTPAERDEVVESRDRRRFRTLIGSFLIALVLVPAVSTGVAAVLTDAPTGDLVDLAYRIVRLIVGLFVGLCALGFAFSGLARVLGLPAALAGDERERHIAHHAMSAAFTALIVGLLMYGFLFDHDPSTLFATGGLAAYTVLVIVGNRSR